MPDIEKSPEFVTVGLDGRRSKLTLSHHEAVASTREALKNFAIRKSDLEKEFIQSNAEKASERKPEKLKAQEVVSVDLETKTFEVKGGKSRIGIVEATTIKKGREDAPFEVVVTVGTKLDLEVLDNIAKAIKAK